VFNDETPLDIETRRWSRESSADLVFALELGVARTDIETLS